MDAFQAVAGRTMIAVREETLKNNPVTLEMPHRILALTNMFPCPPTNGLQMRDWELLRAFASAGCEINLLTFGQRVESNEDHDEIHQVCKTVEVISHPQLSLSSNADYFGRLRTLPSQLPYSVLRFRSKRMEERVAAWIRSGRVDAVLSHTPFPLINLPPAMDVPLIINCHNVEHLILQRYLAFESNQLRRAYARLESRKLERWEKEACSRASSLLVCSEYDRAVMLELCPRSSVSVVPNVIDVDHYVPSEESDSHTVLYTGGMDWLPNRDAVEFFLAEIFPELRRLNSQVKFVIAGRRGPKTFHQKLARLPDVEFRGPVSDMRLEIARAAICVVPLRIGSGTRFKILEAAAMAKPIVSTGLGAEGLNFVDGKEILIEDAPADFAGRVGDLLENRESRLVLGRAARLAVEKHYSLPNLQSAVEKGLHGWADRQLERAR
jgi:polysaccharide biosynthesis protein PslH